MHLELPFGEALALAASQGPLPALVRSIRAEGSTVHVEVDLNLIPDATFAIRMAAAALGTVSVSATLVGYAAGIAQVAVTFHARQLPAHAVLNHAIGPINDLLRAKGLPDGLVDVRRGPDSPVVHVAVQGAVDAKVDGVTVTGLELRDAVLLVTASVGLFRQR